MTDILRRIYEAAYTSGRNGRKPVALYLGREEYLALRASEEMRQSCLYRPNEEGMWLVGLRLYEVYERSHFYLAEEAL